MRYDTFERFVREYFYHSQPIVLEVRKVNEDATDVMPQVTALIRQSKLPEAEALLVANYSRLVIRGVVTYLPTGIEVRNAWRIHKEGGMP